MPNTAYAKAYRIKPISIPKENLYAGTVTLNPKKALSTWEELSDDKIVARVSVIPQYAHNALAKMLNGKVIVNGRIGKASKERRK